MLALTIDPVKSFMSKLLKEGVFDEFYVKSAAIDTFVRFEIHAVADAPALWADVRSFAFDIIKSGGTPKTMRIILGSNADKHGIDGATALYINIHFEGGKVLLTTGVSYNGFHMDKSGEKLWNAAVLGFLDAAGINYIQS